MRLGPIAAAVIGLGASIASLVDDLGSTATFCAEAGCGTVHASWWAKPFGVPMAAFGVAFFAVALVLSMTRRPRTQRVVAIGGAVFALGLIGVQAFAIGAWCKLCLVADTAAIAFALTTYMKRGLSDWSALVPAAVAAFVVLEPSTPPAQVEVRAEAATIVEYIDFECPYCRKMAARIDEARAQVDHTVRVERRMMPLAMHPGAMPAAIAYCCADMQGKGDAIAHALLAAPPSELTDEGCAKIAVSVGCDLDRYHADVDAAKARVLAESTAARAAGVRGLPTIVIGDRTIVGATASTEELIALMTPR